MPSSLSRKMKLTRPSFLSIFKSWDVAVARPTRRRANKTWSSPVAATSSFILYALAVSTPMNALCIRETLQGSLLAQGLQYACIMLSGMLFGMANGRWLEPLTHTIWRLVTHPSAMADFRRSQVHICATILTVSSFTNLLFLIQWLNRFVDAHVGFKTEAIILVYIMGALTGGAWFMLLRRQAWWGLLLSFAMSMMVVSSVLSAHSWIPLQSVMQWR